MNSASKQLTFFVFAFLTLALAMGMRLGPELADDGAFFLKYAENMADGYFWVWNKGEAPVWGASAPLYPLLIALPIKLGVPPVTAMVSTGVIVASLAFGLTALFLSLNFGYLIGTIFVALTALDTGMMYFSGAGLETPLTIAALALAIWSLLHKKQAVWVGISAGLLFVQKLDLAPVGVLLLLAYSIQEKRLALKPIVIASSIALIWYGFAWRYFGAPVPNSFLTKALYQQAHPKSIDWTWFGSFVFVGGVHLWLLLSSIIAAIFLFKKQLPLLVLLVGLLITHLIAYTIKFPFEPYNWYCMPSVYALLVLGSIGIGKLQFKTFRDSLSLVNAALPLAVVAIIYLISAKTEIQIRNSILNFSSNQEFDRSEAGRWVENNTPQNFKVFTLWGNPAYYSKRHVIDASFLNRHYEKGNLVRKYKPEILILQNNPGSTPMSPIFAFPGSEEYKVVRIFDRTFGHGMDYFFAVLARKDVMDELTNIEPPRNLMRYVENIKLGDQFGILKPNSQNTLFLHPGASTTTEFDFDIDQLSSDIGKQQIRINAKIDSNVPPEAIARGAAVVKLILFNGDTKVGEAIVNTISTYTTTLLVNPNDHLHVVVDNNGSADTDWLLISFN